MELEFLNVKLNVFFVHKPWVDHGMHFSPCESTSLIARFVIVTFNFDPAELYHLDPLML